MRECGEGRVAKINKEIYAKTTLPLLQVSNFLNSKNFLHELCNHMDSIFFLHQRGLFTFTFKQAQTVV